MKKFLFVVLFLLLTIGTYSLIHYQYQVLKGKNQQVPDRQTDNVSAPKKQHSRSTPGKAQFMTAFNKSFTIYSCDLRKVDLRFYQKDSRGHFYKDINSLKTALETQGQKLIFATNAGIFKANRQAVGLYIENGETHSQLNLKTARGNFFLKPNGLFLIRNDQTAAILESTQYPAQASNIKYATQSGPLLLIQGKTHPAFNKGSKNTYIRSGVGLLNAHQVVFAISNKPVNFYNFAQLFKQLGCKNALYLDGNISKMYLPALQRHETGGNFGAMIGVTVKQ